MTDTGGPRGATIVLTGVSRGLGFTAARELVRGRPGDHYVVLARSDAAATAASLADGVRGAHVIGIDCDLASLNEVRRAAAAITTELDAGRLPPLGGFLGNAGVVMPTSNSATVDGFETIFAVNVLAHYLLLRLLQERFVAPAWIVLTSSDTHFGQFRYTLGATPKPRWEGAERLAVPRPGGPNNGSRAYTTSKLGDIYLAHVFARRMPAGVDVYSYNPGLVTGTELFRGAPRPLRVILDLYYGFQSAIGRGSTATQAGTRLAETLLTGLTAESGAYLDRGRDVPSSRESYDPAREDALWDDAARLVGLPTA